MKHIGAYKGHVGAYCSIFGHNRVGHIGHIGHIRHIWVYERKYWGILGHNKAHCSIFGHIRAYCSIFWHIRAYWVDILEGSTYLWSILQGQQGQVSIHFEHIFREICNSERCL